MQFLQKIFNIRTDAPAKRICYLDFARGILILLVLYHHAAAPFNTFVLQFHMPALFVLSGYTEFLLQKQKTFLSYVKSKFTKLIIPYFAFEVINLILFAIINILLKKDLSIADACISIITCINNSYVGLYGRLWFLPAIFVTSVLSYLIKRITKNKTLLILPICLFMFLLSYISSDIIPYRLPFTIDTAFLGTAFFLLGHVCGNAIKYIFESKKHGRILLLLVCSGALFVFCNKIANPSCRMYSNQYDDFLFMVGCAISGTMLTFIVAKFLFLLLGRITFFKNIVFWYSINSLAVFPIHLTIKVLSSPLLAIVGFNNWICLFTVMFIFTIPIVNMITNYFPFMLGTFNCKKSRAA